MKQIGSLLALIARLFLRQEVRHLHEALLALRQYHALHHGERIPESLVSTLLLGEDRRYYNHGGVDLLAILRALVVLVWSGQLTGASTLEQQLVRTLTGARERSIRRKVREILLAATVGRAVAKDDVPGMYLSVAYFGWQMNGIIQACDRLGLDLRTLDHHQAANIVARLKYPEPQFPSRARSLQIRRRTDYLARSWSGRRKDTYVVRRVKQDAAVHGL